MSWSSSLKTQACLLASVCSWCTGVAVRGDTIFMKNGIVYHSQGTPDKDATLIYLWDGLKRTVIRDSKIERIVGDNTYRTGEKFTLSQPLTKHAGEMPKEVISVQAGPWNNLGRRSFRYVGARANRRVSMEQALIEIGPHAARFRGVDGFWQGQVATSQVPREVVTGLLARADRKNQEERERVARFLMDAGWYPEARKALDELVKDFPKTDLAERAVGAKVFMIQAEATARRAEIETCRKALQFNRAAALLKTFTEKEIGTELLIDIREQMRRQQDQRASDVALATDIRKLEGKLSQEIRGAWKKRVAEVVKAVDLAPDAVRGRFVTWNKARAGGASSDEAQFALAMSGFVAGSDSAVADLKTADVFWQARELVREYLTGADAATLRRVLSPSSRTWSGPATATALPVPASWTWSPASLGSCRRPLLTRR